MTKTVLISWALAVQWPNAIKRANVPRVRRQRKSDMKPPNLKVAEQASTKRQRIAAILIAGPDYRTMMGSLSIEEFRNWMALEAPRRKESEIARRETIGDFHFACASSATSATCERDLIVPT